MPKEAAPHSTESHNNNINEEGEKKLKTSQRSQFGKIDTTVQRSADHPIQFTLDSVSIYIRFTVTCKRSESRNRINY